MTLLFDTVLCIISIAFAFYLLSFYGLAGNAVGPAAIALFVLTNALFFFFFKTNEISPEAGNFKSALRVLDAVSGSFVAVMLLNISLKLTGRLPLIPNLVLIVGAFLNFLMIGGYRFAASLFQAANSGAEALLSVALYGDTPHLASIKAAIENDPARRYKLVSVFADAVQPASVAAATIHRKDDIQQLLKKHPVDLLLFCGSSLSNKEKSGVVALCLGLQIPVKDIPPHKDWIGGKPAISQLRDVSVEAMLGRKEEHDHPKDVLDLLEKKSILITGAAGSIGSELARQIAAVPHRQLILCDQHETGLYELDYELSAFNLEKNKPVICVGDIRDEEAMKNIFKTWQPQIVFHAAAYKHVPMMEANPSEAIKNNVLGTRVLTDLSLKFGVERFLLVSTDKAINPTNVMGASKRIAEMYLQAVSTAKKVIPLNAGVNQPPKHSTRFITTRFGNVIGSNGSVIPRFREQIASGGPVTVTHPDIIRYFMTMSEACALVLEAVTMGTGGEVYRFDMGEPVKIVDLAEKMIKLAGYKPGKDIKIVFTGLRPGEKLFEEMLHKEQELVTTHNKKILVSKMTECDYYAINESVNALLEAASKNRDEDVVRQMKRIIPEYISNNSVYQSFDETGHSKAVASQ